MIDKYITQKILEPKYQNYDIEGAPFKIGENVVVLNNPSNDETFGKKFVGRKGMKAFYEYDCGCGQSYPNDPMIGVKFSNGKIAEFWKEEIAIV